MNYSEFPFVCLGHDFESVAFDATRWDNGEYNIHMVFFKQWADDDTGQRAEGVILNTPVGGSDLQELLESVQRIIGSGILAGVEILDHGTLYDENGNEIDTLCWPSIHQGTQCSEDSEGEVSVSVRDLPESRTIH